MDHASRSPCAMSTISAWSRYCHHNSHTDRRARGSRAASKANAPSKSYRRPNGYPVSPNFLRPLRRSSRALAVALAQALAEAGEADRPNHRASPTLEVLEKSTATSPAPHSNRGVETCGVCFSSRPRCPNGVVRAGFQPVLSLRASRASVRPAGAVCAACRNLIGCLVLVGHDAPYSDQQRLAPGLLGLKIRRST